MLINDSYNHKEVNRQIIEAVGAPYSIWTRIKMNGIGSPRTIIEASSPEIQRLMELDNNANWCFIELRPKGIIIRFRSLLETYALVIPWWKLVIFKSEADLHTLHCDGNYVRIKTHTKPLKAFMLRLMELKAQPKEA
jgi:hypothetical protein